MQKPTFGWENIIQVCNNHFQYERYKLRDNCIFDKKIEPSPGVVCFVINRADAANEKNQIIEFLELVQQEIVSNDPYFGQ